MHRTIFKITIILLFIVTLPMGVYLTRELATLNENEAMVERVFGTQLESILLSLNQYSESLVSRWAQNIDQPIEIDGELMEGFLNTLFVNNPGIEAALFYNLKESQETASFRRNDSISFSFILPPSENIKKLQDYIEVNYQKVESLKNEDKVQLYFLLKNNERNTLCMLLLHPLTYIEQGLGSQIQQITRDIFYLEIQDTLVPKLIYNTEEIQEVDSVERPLQKIAMWYLPNYEMGIRLKAKTVKQMASERTQQNSYILWGMALVVLLGLAFVIWSIRREMKLAELKSEFVSNVSHEIRTPLALISMYAETLMLKRLKTEEKRDEYLKTIQLESNRLTDIVNRILNFSKIEKNKRTYDFQMVDLNKLIPHIIDSAKSRFAVHGVNYQYQASEEVLSIRADQASVSDMLMNLIDNAIKYGKEDDKQLKIRVSKKKKYIWLEVEDNGIGISAKDQKFVFNQFYRVTDGDLALKAKGSGLGLNMVKKMMMAHSGVVSLKSKQGEGSTFILKFPIKRIRNA